MFSLRRLRSQINNYEIHRKTKNKFAKFLTVFLISGFLIAPAASLAAQATDEATTQDAAVRGFVFDFSNSKNGNTGCEVSKQNVGEDKLTDIGYSEVCGEQIDDFDKYAMPASISSPEVETQIRPRASDVLSTLANDDIQSFSAYVDPKEGIALNTGITLGGKFTQSEILNLATSTKSISWGTAEASGNPISMPFTDFFARFSMPHWSESSQTAFNQILRGGSTSPNLFIKNFPNKPFITYYIPGKNDSDWIALNLVFDKASDGQWYLIGMATDEWSI